MKSHTPRRGCMGPWGARPAVGYGSSFLRRDFLLGWDALTVLTHRAHRLIVAEAVVIPIRAARIEVKFEGVDLAVRRR